MWKERLKKRVIGPIGSVLASQFMRRFRQLRGSTTRCDFLVSRVEPKLCCFDTNLRSVRKWSKRSWDVWFDSKQTVDHGVRYHEMEFARQVADRVVFYAMVKLLTVGRQSSMVHPQCATNKRIFTNTCSKLRARTPPYFFGMQSICLAKTDRAYSKSYAGRASLASKIHSMPVLNPQKADVVIFCVWRWVFTGSLRPLPSSRGSKVVVLRVVVWGRSSCRMVGLLASFQQIGRRRTGGQTSWTSVHSTIKERLVRLMVWTLSKKDNRCDVSLCGDFVAQSS